MSTKDEKGMTSLLDAEVTLEGRAGEAENTTVKKALKFSSKAAYLLKKILKSVKVSWECVPIF